MSDAVASLTIVLATALSVTFLLPQVTRLARTGDAAGLSPTWPVLGLVLNTAWVLYLVPKGLWPAAAPTGVLLLPYAYIAWTLHRLGWSFLAPLLRGAAAVAALGAAALVAGWDGVGAVLGVSYAVQLSPAVWSAYRTWAPSGIDPRTWLLGLAEGVLWAIYGWHHGDAAVQLFGAAAVVGSTLLLVRRYATRRRITYEPAALTAPC